MATYHVASDASSSFLGVDMQESVIQASPSDRLHPYLEALRVSGVPAELILP